MQPLRALHRIPLPVTTRCGAVTSPWRCNAALRPRGFASRFLPHPPPTPLPQPPRAEWVSGLAPPPPGALNPGARRRADRRRRATPYRSMPSDTNISRAPSPTPYNHSTSGLPGGLFPLPSPCWSHKWLPVWAAAPCAILVTSETLEPRESRGWAGGPDKGARAPRAGPPPVGKDQRWRMPNPEVLDNLAAATEDGGTTPAGRSGREPAVREAARPTKHATAAGTATRSGPGETWEPRATGPRGAAHS